MSPTEVERQRERIMGFLLFVRDREYPFAEDVNVDEADTVDPNLGVMAKVYPLFEVLRLGGSYELVSQIWAQLTPSAVRVNIDGTWSRDDVLVVIFTCCAWSKFHHVCIFFVACSVHHSQWDVASDIFSWHQLAEIKRELQHIIRGEG